MQKVVVGQLTDSRMLSSVSPSLGTVSSAHEVPFHFMARASDGSSVNQPTAMQKVVVLQLTPSTSTNASGPIAGDVSWVHFEPFHFSVRIWSPPDLNTRPTAMQKEAEMQLMPLSSISVLLPDGGDGTTAIFVPFHFSLSVFWTEGAVEETPTARQSLELAQLTADSDDEVPTLGDVTTVHPAASPLTAVSTSKAPTDAIARALVRRPPAIRLGKARPGMCNPPVPCVSA